MRFLKYVIPALICKAACSFCQQGNRSPQEYVDEFEQFIIDYGKVYETEEEKQYRFEIFKNNLDAIDRHNAQGESHREGINHFTDLTQEEFLNSYTGLRQDYNEGDGGMSSLVLILSFASEQSETVPREIYYYNPKDSLPDDVDWTLKGCVSDVKDQGTCGSCWAFSAIEAVEGAICVKHGILLDLSEQQLIDCSRREGEKGCHGGSVDLAFVYMIRERNLCSEEAYPYEAHRGRCRANKCKSDAQVVRIVDIPHYDDMALRSALVNEGPIAVGVEADSWQMYAGGIFKGPCGANLNHGVLLTGFGTENGTDYWVLKNSWGPLWGENGYIRIARETNKPYGVCGILLSASFPRVA